MKVKFIVIIGLCFIVLAFVPWLASSDKGTAWGPGAFKSNGERIYFTATSNRGTPITYRGGVEMGMMMMGGRLACVSCHGPGAKGGRHRMHMMVMDAPDIRWSTLEKEEEHGEGKEEGTIRGHGEYTVETFKKAVIEGKHPDGKPLKYEMPRWTMSDEDLIDLANYLKSLP